MIDDAFFKRFTQISCETPGNGAHAFALNEDVRIVNVNELGHRVRGCCSC